MKRIFRTFLIIIVVICIAKYGTSNNSPSTSTKTSASQVTSNNTLATLAPSSPNVSSSSTVSSSSSNSIITQQKETPSRSITLSDFKKDSFVLEYARSLNKIHGLEYKSGDSGSSVRAIQKLLANSGYLSSSGIDGGFGSITADAITRFQSDHNLTQTGIANLGTQFLLLAKAPDVKFEETKNGTFIINFENYSFILWKAGTSYIGQTESSYTFYQGTYIFSEKEYYAGKFSNDKRSGDGTAYFSNGDVYIGHWENDKMNGNGKYYFGGLNSKETYDGEWSNNKMNGRGTYTLANGTIITGKWSNNKHISW